MKNTIRILLRVLLIFFILFLVTRIFKKADEARYGSEAKSVFSTGNAPDSIRIEVLRQLQKFQDGYTKRDASQVESFMQELYSKDNVLILGTMPREIYKGHERATELVKTDWESWGDCKFAVDSTNVSSNGNVAWFSTRGYVKFDLSSLLVIPLRLTGVMVNENGSWKFQQQQFQFDIDFSFNLVAIILLSGWLIVGLIILFIQIFRNARERK